MSLPCLCNILQKKVEFAIVQTRSIFIEKIQTENSSKKYVDAIYIL